jgi:hypothetical protein
MSTLTHSKHSQLTKFYKKERITMMTTMKKFSFKKVFKCMVCKDNASLCAGQISGLVS